MNTESLDQSHAIDTDDKVSKSLETIRKRGIDCNADLNSSKKRSKYKIDKDSSCHRQIEDMKESIQVAATKFKTFPERMMEIIEKPNLKEAIYWLPDGKSFGLFPYPFTDKVLNKFFQGAKFESFTRKLNRWGFKRVFDDKYDPEAHIYYHPMFQKGRLDLLKNLSGSSSKKKHPEQDKVTPPTQQVFPTPPNTFLNPDVKVSMAGPLMMQQRLLTNNLNEPNVMPSSFGTQLPFVVSNQHLVSNPMSSSSIDRLMLEQRLQVLHHQQRQQQQQQQILLAQLQSTQRINNNHPIDSLSIQELNFLRNQNADRVRLLQQLRQQQQQQSPPQQHDFYPPPTSSM